MKHSQVWSPTKEFQLVWCRNRCSLETACSLPAAPTACSSRCASAHWTLSHSCGVTAGLLRSGASAAPRQILPQARTWEGKEMGRRELGIEWKKEQRSREKAGSKPASMLLAVRKEMWSNNRGVTTGNKEPHPSSSCLVCFIVKKGCFCFCSYLFSRKSLPRIVVIFLCVLFLSPLSDVIRLFLLLFSGLVAQYSGFLTQICCPTNLCWSNARWARRLASPQEPIYCPQVKCSLPSSGSAEVNPD